MTEPDVRITDYLERWYIIPRNKWFNIYLHRFLKSDGDRELHDHPWWSLSFLIKGHLFEECKDYIRVIHKWYPYLRSAKHRHRLYLMSGEAWTVFITGPEVREWGFWTDDGWVQWQKFIGDKR